MTNEKKVKIQPLQDRVLIREHNEEKETRTKSGIIIPVSAGAEEKGGKRGEIVAVGPGRYEEGKIVPLSVKVGQVVLFQWGDKIQSDGEEYYIVRESEIIAVIK